MITTMLQTADPAEYRAAVQALDRVLTAGRYVVPIWYSDRARLAHDARLTYPEKLPIYGLFPGFYPDTFWVEE
jgi:peptide/nickel transport system substrate-binding protein